MASRADLSERVLKLVHPGGYVEVYTEPVTAAQVMKKYPRHCITRTDFFSKFPKIVVRPESVLQLGRVFLIVPNRTIYHLLLETSPQLHQSSLLQQRLSSKHHHRHGHLYQQFQIDSLNEADNVSKSFRNHTGKGEVLLSTTDNDATSDNFEGGVTHRTSAREMMDEYNLGEISTQTIPAKVKCTPPRHSPSEFIIKLLQFLVPLPLLGWAATTIGKLFTVLFGYSGCWFYGYLM